MKVSKFDITLATALTVFIVGGQLMAGMASVLVIGCVIAAAHNIDNNDKFFA
ncbi:hypothetical protein ORJ66_10065 [Pseudoalteromonas tunicata]|uniref:hypothetical protein n=1 Tax=Pseudoalteromonas tunicata TaxID=314281 RepID=UPI00273EDDAC|nr:hypothetical protein [Pseudoalteromonas tunicata]MDP5213384.1 hypothetical protein [Pseudoalteromonas tunicata]